MNRFCFLILPVALAACSDTVTPAMIKTAQTACAPFGGLKSFERVDENTGFYVRAWCNENRTVVYTRVGTNKDKVFLGENEVLPATPDSAEHSASQASAPTSPASSGVAGKN